MRYQSMPFKNDPIEDTGYYGTRYPQTAESLSWVAKIFCSTAEIDRKTSAESMLV
jgi:ribosomal protein L16 Arg81 hydroxylase